MKRTCFITETYRNAGDAIRALNPETVNSHFKIAADEFIESIHITPTGNTVDSFIEVELKIVVGQG